jgi:cholest-4-en-3-one 26-monooxygenase
VTITNDSPSADVNPDEIDLSDLDVFAERCPHDWFTYLRETAPVWQNPPTEASGNEPFWNVTSYELIQEVHRSGTLYSHQTGPGRDGAGGITLTDLEAGRGPGLQMVMTDPPQHTSYRKLVNSGFTPRMIRRLEDAFRLRTTAILDQVTPAGSCDFVTSVAAELPLMAIAEIIGVPVEDRDKLFDWSNRTIGGADEEYSQGTGGQTEGEDFDDSTNAMIEMAMYAHDLTDRKRENPADDLWTRLTEAVVTMDDGSRVELTELERDLFFTLLVVAGNETTRNGISKGMMAFFDHPEQWNRWKEAVADGSTDSGLADTMVDEVLRFTSPVNFFRRTATEDTVLGDVTIAAGDKVALWYPAGNRDEAEFGPDAQLFDISRTPNHHMAFGAGGAHFCLGANLARLEIKIIFEELARRTPDIHPTGPAQRLRMNLVDGIKHLPVEFTPSPAKL